MIDIKTPNFPESVQDGTILVWHKKIGDSVSRDEILLEIETDKIVLEVPSPLKGTLMSIEKKEGSVVVSGELLALIDETAVSSVSAKDKSTQTTDQLLINKNGPAARKILQESNIDPNDIVPTGREQRITTADIVNHLEDTSNLEGVRFASPAALKLCMNHGIDPVNIRATGKGNRVTKVDIKAHISQSKNTSSSAQNEATNSDQTRRVPMSRLRIRVAEKLLEAKQQTAMLTTFNEVDMSNIMTLRKQYKDVFQEKFGVKLGFMSFFVRAATLALQNFPEVNAQIDGTDIVYKNDQHIGVAISSQRGLIVPVLFNTQDMGFSDIESAIFEYGQKAKEGKIDLENLLGGTFTISNGGIFGSLLSTPILNHPQTAILGMHTIQERVIVIKGEMCIRPMMYLALSYDHRLIDGKDAVQFLASIKNMLEQPARIALNL